MGKYGSLADEAPEIAAEWHPTMNGELQPEDVSARSNRVAVWFCDEADDHIWTAPIANRTRQPKCPFCVGRRVAPSNSLLTKKPELAQEWHAALNGDLTAAMVTVSSERKVWWQCQSDPSHEWEASVASRSRIKGANCPYCTGKAVTEKSSLASKCPEVLEIWDYEKNSKLTPQTVSPYSNRRAHFRCPRGHRFHCLIFTVTSTFVRHGRWPCDICSNKRTTHENCLATIYPHLLEEWDYAANEKRGLTPENITGGAKVNADWVCNRDSRHRWSADISSRAKANATCPYCINQKTNASNCLAATHPMLAAEFDIGANAPLTPKDITAGYAGKVAWKCQHNEEHQWIAPPINRRGTPQRPGTQCPHCNRGSQISRDADGLFTELRAWYPSLITERDVKHIEKLKVGDWSAPFDAYIPELRLYIEYDGSYWHQGNEERDLRKNQAAARENKRVLRLRENGLKPLGENDLVVPRPFDLDYTVSVALARIAEIASR